MQLKEMALEPRPLPVRSRSARISIDALLNPSGNEDSTVQQHSHDAHYCQVYHHSPPPRHQDLRFCSEPSMGSETSMLAYGTGSEYPSYRYGRFNSVSSSSTTTTKRRRPPRPKYQEEEMYFIWYHRVDLEEEWKEVQDRFNQQFPTRQRRGFQGLQCKFYRFIKEKRCPAVREQRRISDGESPGRGPKSELLPKYGVSQWCNVWYPWMRREHAQNSQSSVNGDDEIGDPAKRCYINSSIGSTPQGTLTPRSRSPSDPGEEIRRMSLY